MIDIDRLPFTLGEERTIDGVSYTCVRIDRSDAARVARHRVFEGNLCGRCPFSILNTATGTLCQSQCNSSGAYDGSSRLIVTTSLVPTLALEGLLT